MFDSNIFDFILILAVVPLSSISVCILCKFSMLLEMCIFLSLRKKRCNLFPVGTDAHIWQHIRQKD